MTQTFEIRENPGYILLHCVLVANTVLHVPTQSNCIIYNLIL